MALTGIKLLLSILFLGFACVAFFTMLHLLGTPNAPRAKLLRIIHRASGGIAVALYVITAVMCIGGLRRTGATIPSVVALHLTFGMLFIPMILMKVVIVEKYPELRNRLFSIGMVIFVIVFVIFFTSALAPLLEGREGELTGSGARASMDLGLAKDLFVVKCAKCHRLDRPLSAGMTPAEWKETVERMRQKDPSWISESEALKITGFLASLGE
jgi:hypothetical protein